MEVRADKMNMNETAGILLDKVREQSPLIHQITNYVTTGDCANITLAMGASPVMADDIAETEEITGISSALVLNIGTLNERTLFSMLASGRRANALGIPVILDPVGAGASELRNKAANEILEQVRLAAIRGNRSEISFLAGLRSSTRGVDVSPSDEKIDGVSIAREIARRYRCAAAVTGEADIVSDGNRTIMIQNGHPMLARVTGTGCMCTALIASLAAVTKDYLSAAVCGVAAMGIAGEIAFDKAGSLGTGSFRIALTDAVSSLDRSTLESRMKIHEV